MMEVYLEVQKLFIDIQSWQHWLPLAQKCLHNNPISSTYVNLLTMHSLLIASNRDVLSDMDRWCSLLSKREASHHFSVLFF